MKILAKQTRTISRILSLQLYGFKIIKRNVMLYLSTSQSLYTEHIYKDFEQSLTILKCEVKWRNQTSQISALNKPSITITSSLSIYSTHTERKLCVHGISVYVHVRYIPYLMYRIQFKVALQPITTLKQKAENIQPTLLFAGYTKYRSMALHPVQMQHPLLTHNTTVLTRDCVISFWTCG